MLSDAVSLTKNGRLFQRVGPDTEKRRGPERTDRVLGITKSRHFLGLRKQVVSRGRNHRMQHLDKVRRRLVSSALVDKHADLVFNSLFDGKPVQPVSHIGRD